MSLQGRVNWEVFKKALEEQIPINGGVLTRKKVMSILHEQVNPINVRDNHRSRVEEILPETGLVYDPKSKKYYHEDYGHKQRLAG